jgi:hypothetical protein
VCVILLFDTRVTFFTYSSKSGILLWLINFKRARDVTQMSVEELKGMIKKRKCGQVPVSHTCNLSYLEG